MTIEDEAMKVNGARWEVVNVRLSKGENKQPDYVAINPNRSVPAL